MAAAALAKRMLSTKGRPSTKATASAPQKISPAAVVSTTLNLVGRYYGEGS